LELWPEMAGTTYDPLFGTNSYWFYKFLSVISIVTQQGLNITFLRLSPSHTMEQHCLSCPFACIRYFYTCFPLFPISSRIAPVPEYYISYTVGKHVHGLRYLQQICNSSVSAPNALFSKKGFFGTWTPTIEAEASHFNHSKHSGNHVPSLLKLSRSTMPKNRLCVFRVILSKKELLIFL
jgi:hypothetical protein